MKLEFSRRILEKYSDKNFVKMRPLGAELFRTDRQAHIQTDGRTDGQTERERESRRR